MPANRPNLRPPAGGLPLLRRPAPRRLLAVIALAVLLIAAAAPAVSAENIIDEELSTYQFTGGTVKVPAGTNSAINGGPYKHIVFQHIENHPDLSYVAFTVSASGLTSVPTDGEHSFTYTGLTGTKTGRMHVQYSYNFLGQVSAYNYLLFFDDWDIGTKTGATTIELSQALWSGVYRSNPATGTNDLCYLKYGGQYPLPTYDVTVSSTKVWKNRLTVDIYDWSYWINLQRVYNTGAYASTIAVLNGTMTKFTEASSADFSITYLQSDIDSVTLNSGENIYEWSLDTTPSAPTNATATVYVRSSQTGALLANTHILIEESEGVPDVYYETVNTTLPSGSGSFSLRKTVDFSPLYYRITATLEGYNQVAALQTFELTADKNIIVEMDPISGGPADPENTYLEFYVRDLNANPIPGAIIEAAGTVRQTNTNGFAQYEVAINSSYAYKVSKFGYVTIEGTATVADAPRYPVNVVLGPGSVPTYTPTPDPSTGETPGATPTPDHRTNEEKGQSIIDMIGDNAEGIAALAIIGTLLGLLKLIAKW